MKRRKVIRALLAISLLGIVLTLLLWIAICRFTGAERLMTLEEGAVGNVPSDTNYGEICNLFIEPLADGSQVVREEFKLELLVRLRGESELLDIGYEDLQEATWTVDDSSRPTHAMMAGELSDFVQEALRSGGEIKIQKASGIEGGWSLNVMRAGCPKLFSRRGP
jgi:hypothetical protein